MIDNILKSQIELFRSVFKGRQAFFESQPQNFTRILHDYSDDRKGFVIWKIALEEILV